MFGELQMAQAKVLTTKELRRVLDHISTRPHAGRNRAILLLTHWAAMRIGEVAALRVEDILGKDGTVKSEIRLDAARTKAKRARKRALREVL